MGLDIADCQLPIFDWRLATKSIGIRKSTIGNQVTHPLPRGGTDFIPTEKLSQQTEDKGETNDC